MVLSLKSRQLHAHICFSRLLRNYEKVLHILMRVEGVDYKFGIFLPVSVRTRLVDSDSLYLEQFCLPNVDFECKEDTPFPAFLGGTV